DAIFFHQVNQMRRAAIADAQPPLQCRSRSTPHFAANAYCVLVELVVGLFAGLASVRRAFKAFFHLAILIARSFEQAGFVLALRRLRPEIANTLNLISRRERPVNAMRAGCPRR